MREQERRKNDEGESDGGDKREGIMMRERVKERNANRKRGRNVSC